MSFKQIRIALLLAVLAMVAWAQFSEKARIASWEVPLYVAVYPFSADGSSAADRYVEALDTGHFDLIVSYLERQAERHGVALDQPMYIKLGRPIEETPPPAPIGGSAIQRLWWVAKMRWWRLRFDDQGLDPDVIVLARYFAPVEDSRLPHSTGVEKLRIAVANLYASRRMQGQNAVVLAHELLHTIGASDKYDLATNQPLVPGGLAEPERNPVYPQSRAEIMAGRIAVSATRARQAESLNQTVIGPATAREIGWID